MFDEIVERAAFEPFAALGGVLTGAPIRVFPEGTFYRGDRKLTVTRDRLQEFAANVKAGLPRFEIPINIEHRDEYGRYGTVEDLEYFENGPQGPGLYATKYSLTDEGKKLLEQEKFIGLSGEAIWTLFDGAKYQDPQTGKNHDNVLVGLALTNKPFFGKQVNMYSATESDEYRTFTEEERKTMAKSGAAMPGGRYPIANADDLQNAIHDIGRGKGSHAAIKAHIIKRARALGLTKSLPEDWKASDTSPTDEEMAAMMQEDEPDGDEAVPADNKAKAIMPMQHSAADAARSETMAGEKPKDTAPPEQFAVNAEEFKAIKAKAEMVDAMAARMKALERARRIDQLTAHAESFSAVPAKPNELAEKFAALEEHDPDLFKFFDGLLTTMDNQVTTGGLFSQMASARGGDKVESFSDLADSIVKEQFKGDMSRYADAMSAARKQRPDLWAQYDVTYSKRPKITRAPDQEQ